MLYRAPTALQAVGFNPDFSYADMSSTNNVSEKLFRVTCPSNFTIICTKKHISFRLLHKIQQSTFSRYFCYCFRAVEYT